MGRLARPPARGPVDAQVPPPLDAQWVRVASAGGRLGRRSAHGLRAVSSDGPSSAYAAAVERRNAHGLLTGRPARCAWVVALVTR
jgi:hypothetical protein